MERPNAKGANNFVIGLFVFVSLLVGAGFVVFMGGSSTIGGEAKIRTVFVDVRGLNVGAPVFLSGIQVGRVSEFKFPESSDGSANDTIETVLSIYKANRGRIRKDSEASITTQGVLGDKVIVITPGSKEAGLLGDNDILTAKVPKDISDYLSKGGNLVENLNQVAANLNAMIKQMNDANHLPQILENLDRTTASLAATTKNLRESNGTIGALINGGPKDDLGPALKSLHHVLDKIDRGEGTLGALVNDPSLHEDMRVLLGGAKRSQMVRFLIRQAISSGDKKDGEQGAPKK